MLGDAIGRVLEAAGASVAREFYINDLGNQMDLFGASLEASALGKPIPEDGYQGAYIADLAAEIVRRQPDIVDLPEGERLGASSARRATTLQLEEQQDQLDGFDVHFDVWFSRARPACRRVAARSSRRAAQRLTDIGQHSTRPTARCGCAPRTSATTRTG